VNCNRLRRRLPSKMVLASCLVVTVCGADTILAMAELSASELARQLALKRARMSKHCMVCGVEFVGRSDQLYCSLTCKTRALRKRKKETEGREP
jgi:hypothetical protein